MELVVAGAVQRQQLAPQRAREGPVLMCQHARRGLELDQHAVHPVERGAGHQADEQHHSPSATPPAIDPAACSCAFVERASAANSGCDEALSATLSEALATAIGSRCWPLTRNS